MSAGALLTVAEAHRAAELALALVDEGHDANASFFAAHIVVRAEATGVDPAATAARILDRAVELDLANIERRERADTSRVLARIYGRPS